MVDHRPRESFLVVNDLTLTNPLAPPRRRCSLDAALMLVSYAAFFPSAPRAARVGGGIATAVPIAGGAICVGLLMHAALSTGNPVTVWLAGAALFVGLAAAAFLLRENQQLVRELAEEAATDKLTGLPNRRALIDDLDRAVAAARRTRSRSSTSTASRSTTTRSATPPVTRCCSASRRARRVGGRAYRLGGDEFCVLTDAALATIAGERAVAALTRGDGSRSPRHMGSW